MTKFVTFDGSIYHNISKATTVEFKTIKKEIDKKEYLYLEILIDSEKIFESMDYKIYDLYNNDRIFKNYSDMIKNKKALLCV